MICEVASHTKADGTEYGYFCQEEIPEAAPRSGDETHPCESFTHDRGDFSLGGHRLPSLYRICKPGETRLRIGVSSVKKFSTGVRGCEAAALFPGIGAQ